MMLTSMLEACLSLEDDKYGTSSSSNEDNVQKYSVGPSKSEILKETSDMIELRSRVDSMELYCTKLASSMDERDQLTCTIAPCKKIHRKPISILGQTSSKSKFRMECDTSCHPLGSTSPFQWTHRLCHNEERKVSSSQPTQLTRSSFTLNKSSNTKSLSNQSKKLNFIRERRLNNLAEPVKPQSEELPSPIDSHLIPQEDLSSNSRFTSTTETQMNTISSESNIVDRQTITYKRILKFPHVNNCVTYHNKESLPLFNERKFDKKPLIDLSKTNQSIYHHGKESTLHALNKFSSRQSFKLNKLSLSVFFYVILSICMIPIEAQVLPCPFNAMCKCRYEAQDEASRSRIPSPIEVVCVGVPFAKFPKLPAGQMDQVDVVNAGLELLGGDDFDLTRVKNLRLMSNNIRKIGSKTLSEMGHVLLTLDLSYNTLVDIPREALRHLAALEWLNLQGNQIAEVKRDDWNGLRDTLTSLFLAENNIDHIDPHVLTDFRKLLWVNLDDNNINRLERDSLSRSINTLSLNHNLLISFPLDTVSEFKDLTWLYLRGNLIDRLPDRGFVFPKNIDRLDLGENFISFIPNNLFNETLSVRDLHFDFNLLTEIQDHVFQGLNPSRLYLSANKIFNISDRAFMGGPQETIVMLDLEKNNLNSVPRALATLINLRYLYLPGNQITNIDRNAFRGSCSKLEALSFSGNLLKTIPREGLENCSMINHLNLGHNGIEQITAGDFETWGDNLETLVLRNNRIVSIPANAFKHTPRLRELSLSFNRIVDINPDSFIDILGTLEILEISFGFYRDDFPEEVFKPLTSLQWIALDNNNFRTISETALYSFGELNYFNMDSNRLTIIPKTLFHQNVHKKLVDIRMANNFLDDLHTHTFHNLESLRTIVLTGNKIKTVYFEAFKTLPLLNTIALSHNQISEIESQAFSGLSTLTELDLQQNKLTKFSLNAFANLSASQTPLSLNLSHNAIVDLTPGSIGQYPMKNIDISHNYMKQVPINFLQVFVMTLERLYLGYNVIKKLDTSAFGPLEKLQLLTLEHNNIQQIRPGAFNSLREVQILDLSHNHLQSLPHMCFSDMTFLRKIDLSHNHLRAMPPSVFTATSIETINFSYNEFVSMPTQAMSIIESTLHYLDISHNHLEHLDSTMFNSFSNLIELNLASNKLTILPDNVFVSLRNLITLDISDNTVRANFKELFHYTQNVQKLNLARIGFTSSPTIPLPNLVSLNMSHNGIADIEVHSVISLRQLRSLDLSHNEITHVHSRIWPYLPYLQTLDMSYNPIVSLTKDSFMGASRIETLALKSLDRIKRFDYDTLSHMGFLKELYMNTFPNIEKYRFRVGQLLATVHTLRSLHLEVREEALTDQLYGAFGPKLKELHITGRTLKTVEDTTFRGFQNKHELLLAITDTSIESLPNNLLDHLSDVAYLSLDLRRNRLKYLNSRVLYGNETDWESIGTTFVAGGLALQGNDWTCDCSLVWLGNWLRRWLRETLQIHTAVLKKAQQVDQLAREAVCTDPITGQKVSLLDLRFEDLSCHASALNGTVHSAADSLGCVPSSLILLTLVPISIACVSSSFHLDDYRSVLNSLLRVAHFAANSLVSALLKLATVLKQLFEWHHSSCNDSSVVKTFASINSSKESFITFSVHFCVFTFLFLLIRTNTFVIAAMKCVICFYLLGVYFWKTGR